MKYIKKFENNEDILNIKKYVLWKMKTCIIILEVNSIDEHFVHMTRLYKYYNDPSEYDYNRVTRIDKQKYEFSYSEVREHAIYSSDNLDDCLDLDLLAASFIANKYNI